jgi:metal-sulfur cluster biosynthetic enzyme
MTDADRSAEIWSALGAVTDPEIDESVTSLEFITSVRIESGNSVRIEFRLPTYWCASNFAFLMASDMRDAVAELSWVEKVTVELLDHFSANLINRGVAARKDFRDAFPGKTDDDLSAVKRKSLEKAFERRQELLIRHLLRNGRDLRWISSASLRDLTRSQLSGEGAALRQLYIFVWRRLFPGLENESLAFTTVAGTPLEASGLAGYLRRVAFVRRNAEFNGFICRGLLAARNQVPTGRSPHLYE